MSLPITHMAFGRFQMPPDHCRVHCGAPYHCRQRIASVAQLPDSSARVVAGRISVLGLARSRIDAEQA